MPQPGEFIDLMDDAPTQQMPVVGPPPPEPKREVPKWPMYVWGFILGLPLLALFLPFFIECVVKIGQFSAGILD